MDWHYEEGQRVKQEIDIYDPSRGTKKGTIIGRYSIPEHTIGYVVLGPYPELYKVRFDDGSVEQGFFWFGLTPIK